MVKLPISMANFTISMAKSPINMAKMPIRTGKIYCCLKIFFTVRFAFAFARA
jgi:hypothetical protein